MSIRANYAVAASAAEIVLATVILVLAACTGNTGPPGVPGPAGAPAADRGVITGTVKGPTGAPVAGATVSTDPSTTTAQTDATGTFALASIPIGSYKIVASKAGYVDGALSAVGVAAGASVHVDLVLAPLPPATGSLSGTVRGSKGPIAGAQVCVEGSAICSTSGSNGTYTLSGVSPGSLFVSAEAGGFLPGETRQAAVLTAGASLQGVDVMLSGRPTDTATYVGSNACLTCHSFLNSGLVAEWQASAHHGVLDRTTSHIDVTGWPAAPADCTAPATQDTGFMATDPNPAILDNREVYLVRWKAGCTGEPEFAMALDTNQNGTVDTADTVMPVNRNVGGVATGAGQCGNGGIIPAGAQCAATFAGSGATATTGWWQQEYLMDIGPASKPSWVTWDTTGAPTDALILPAAWNQRAQQWVPAPDYDPTQDGTHAKHCVGCHETGVSLAADASGHVTSYSSVEPDIGCEKCHGPGSDHAKGIDPYLIINPAHLTAQSENEVCEQCHSNGVASTNPAGAFGFAWNSQAAVGGGNFIPGVHRLADFRTAPSYGNSDFYWPSGFPSVDHMTAVDFEASVHANNPSEKLTCPDCHSPHSGIGGPSQFQRTDAQAGDQYVFQNNDATLRDDVRCLACHATHGSFASLTLEDVARYHISAGGAVQKNGTAWTASAEDQATSAGAVAAAVDAHMIAQAGMSAYFDPTGTVGAPDGRCSSCHMAKTASTAQFYSGADASGKTANVIGDVSSHTFRVAWPEMSLTTVASASSWDGVMPNACGACHVGYRFGK
jgi:hypothetical protein